MSDATRLLEAANRGDRQAAADLLPLIYEELRNLASARVAGEGEEVACGTGEVPDPREKK